MLLWFERGVEYDRYIAEVEFLDSEGKGYVENVKWITQTQSASFNQMRVVYRLIYFFISLLLIVLWVIPLRSLSLAQWPFEHRCILVILISLAFFDNPFFFLQFSHNATLFALLDSFLHTTFVCILLCFWSLYLDHVRWVDPQERNDPMNYVKYFLILLFGILSVSLSLWVEDYFAMQSVLGQGGEVSGMIFLFYVTNCLFGGLLIYIIAIGALVYPTTFQGKPYLEVRYLFLAIPSGVVCTSLLMGVFFGSFGPYNSSSTSFLYYFGLLNAYVYLLCFGFYPSVRSLDNEFQAQFDVNPQDQVQIL
jgi:hypothetical protein